MINSYSEILRFLQEFNETDMAEAWMEAQVKANKKRSEHPVIENKKLLEVANFLENLPSHPIQDHIIFAYQIMAKINFISITLAKITHNEELYKEKSQILLETVFKQHCEAQRRPDTSLFIDLDWEAKWLNDEKSYLTYHVNERQNQIEQIQLLKSASLQYKAHLQNEIMKLSKGGRNLTAEDIDRMAESGCTNDTSSACELAFKKLNIVNKMLNDLNSKRNDDRKILDFKATLTYHADLLAKRRDTPTVTFFKVVASVLSVGLLAPFLWRKTEGRKFIENGDLTLMGKHSKGEEFKFDEANDLKPSALVGVKVK